MQGYSATAAGAALLPFILVMFLLSRWSGALADRYGPRRSLIIGPLIAAAGYALFALPGTGGSYWTTFFPAILVLGLGMAVSVAPLTTTVLSAVEQRHAGLSSGINTAVSRGAGLLAIAVLGLLLLGLFGRGLDRRLAALDLSPQARQALDRGREKLAAIDIPASLPDEQRTAVRAAVAESFLGAYRGVMLASAGLALLASLSAWWMIPR